MKEQLHNEAYMSLVGINEPSNFLIIRKNVQIISVSMTKTTYATDMALIGLDMRWPKAIHIY